MDEDYDDGSFDAEDLYDDERCDLAVYTYTDPQNEQQHGNQFIIHFFLYNNFVPIHVLPTNCLHHVRD